MSDNERREHLLLVVDHLLDIWNAWSADSDVRYITQVFEDAVNDCLAIFFEGTIPGNLRPMTNCVLKMRLPWETWQRKNEMSGGRYPLPDSDFWQTLDNIDASRQQLKAPIRKVLEPLAELMKMPGMTPAQVCRMYGFTDSGLSNGEPEIWKLHEELAEPGKHTGPGTGWIAPHERRRLQEQSKQDTIIKRIKSQRDGKLKLLTTVGKESIEELIAQQVCGKQICVIKKINGAELEDYCESNGLPVPPWENESANQITGDYDKTIDEQFLDNILSATQAHATSNPNPVQEEEGLASEALTLEQEIVEYHKSGMMPKDIAVAVSSPGNEISQQKVSKIIDRWKKDPTAFGAILNMNEL